MIEGYKVVIDFHGLTTYPGFKELIKELSKGNDVLVWSRAGRASWVYEGLRHLGYNDRPNSPLDTVIQRINLNSMRVVLEQKLATPFRVVAVDTLSFFDSTATAFRSYGNFSRWERAVLNNFFPNTETFLSNFETWKDDINRRGFYKDPRIFGPKSILIESDGAQVLRGNYTRADHPLTELKTEGVDVIVVPEKETIDEMFDRRVAGDYYQAAISLVRENLEKLPKLPVVKTDIALELGLVKRVFS